MNKRFENMHPAQIIAELLQENERLHTKCRRYKRTVQQLNHGLNKIKADLYNQDIRTPNAIRRQSNGAKLGHVLRSTNASAG